MAIALKRDFGPRERTILALGLIGSPMMLIDGILLVYVWKTKVPDSSLDGFLSLVYMAAWLAIAVGMLRQRIFGKGVGGTILHGVQIAGLVLGSVWSVLQMLHLERMGLLGTATDIAWPASHVFSLVLAVAAWQVGVWKGLASRPAVSSGSRPAPFLRPGAALRRLGLVRVWAVDHRGRRYDGLGGRLARHPTALADYRSFWRLPSPDLA